MIKLTVTLENIPLRISDTDVNLKKLELIMMKDKDMLEYLINVMS